MELSIFNIMGGIRMGDEKITRLAYADDVVLMAESKVELSEMIWQ